MVREIEFRAWDKLTERMVKVNRIDFDEKEIDVVIRKTNATEDYESMSFDEIELMQYTGLRDKKDKEIYESDIVRYIDSDGIVVNGIIKFGKIPDVNRERGGHQGFYIKWQDEASNKWSDWWRNDLYFWKLSVEVIGDIYENPKLIK